MGEVKKLIRIYCIVLAFKERTNTAAKNALSKFCGAAQKVVPARMQPLLLNESGDLTTTIAWLFGIAVIAGVGAAVYTGIIAPNLTAATTKSSGLINSIP